MRTRPHPSGLRWTLAGLRYIAASPPREYGGFHPETVKIAKAALWHLRERRRKLRA